MKYKILILLLALFQVNRAFCQKIAVDESKVVIDDNKLRHLWIDEINGHGYLPIQGKLNKYDLSTGKLLLSNSLTLTQKHLTELTTNFQNCTKKPVIVDEKTATISNLYFYENQKFIIYDFDVQVMVDTIKKRYSIYPLMVMAKVNENLEPEYFKIIDCFSELKTSKLEVLSRKNIAFISGNRLLVPYQNYNEKWYDGNLSYTFFRMYDYNNNQLTNIGDSLTFKFPKLNIPQENFEKATSWNRSGYIIPKEFKSKYDFSDGIYLYKKGKPFTKYSVLPQYFSIKKKVYISCYDLGNTNFKEIKLLNLTGKFNKMRTIKCSNISLIAESAYNKPLHKFYFLSKDNENLYFNSSDLN